VTEDARRTQIVECAIEVIVELGYGAASIRKIAERVGVAMSVVLYHFGTKDELVNAIVERGYRTLLESMTPAVEAESAAIDKVHAFVRTYMTYMAQNRTLLLAVADIGTNYRSSQGLRLDQLSLDPVLQAELANVEIETLLGAVARRGRIGGIPYESVALAVRGALDGAVAVIMRDEHFDTTAYGEDVFAMFTRFVGDER
jgi:AcrR family transcriptional regulator